MKRATEQSWAEALHAYSKAEAEARDPITLRRAWSRWYLEEMSRDLKETLRRVSEEISLGRQAGGSEGGRELPVISELREKCDQVITGVQQVLMNFAQQFETKGTILKDVTIRMNTFKADGSKSLHIVSVAGQPRDADEPRLAEAGDAATLFGIGDALPVDGRVTLKVTQKFVIERQDDFWTVAAWGLQMPLREDKDAAWHLVRAFLDYQQRARTPEGLDAHSKSIFLNMCESLDVHKYCADVAEPTYHVGDYVECGKDKKIRLNWQNEIVVPPALHGRFRVLSSGEDFSGKFYFDEDGGLRDVRDVLPLHKPEPAPERVGQESGTETTSTKD